MTELLVLAALGVLVIAFVWLTRPADPSDPY